MKKILFFLFLIPNVAFGLGDKFNGLPVETFRDSMTITENQYLNKLTTDTAKGLIVNGNIVNYGSIGIGTSGPEQKLNVIGNISNTGTIYSSGTANAYFGSTPTVQGLNCNGTLTADKVNCNNLNASNIQASTTTLYAMIMSTAQSLTNLTNMLTSQLSSTASALTLAYLDLNTTAQSLTNLANTLTLQLGNTSQLLTTSILQLNTTAQELTNVTLQLNSTAQSLTTTILQLGTTAQALTLAYLDLNTTSQALSNLTSNISNSTNTNHALYMSSFNTVDINMITKTPYSIFYGSMTLIENERIAYNIFYTSMTNCEEAVNTKVSQSSYDSSMSVIVQNMDTKLATSVHNSSMAIIEEQYVNKISTGNIYSWDSGTNNIIKQSNDYWLYGTSVTYGDSLTHYIAINGITSIQSLVTQVDVITGSASPQIYVYTSSFSYTDSNSHDFKLRWQAIVR